MHQFYQHKQASSALKIAKIGTALLSLVYCSFSYATLNTTTKKLAIQAYENNAKTFFCQIPFNEKGRLSIKPCEHCKAQDSKIKWFYIYVHINIVCMNICIYRCCRRPLSVVLFRPSSSSSVIVFVRRRRSSSVQYISDIVFLFVEVVCIYLGVNEILLSFTTAGLFRQG